MYTYIKIDDGDLLLFKYQYNTNNINLNLTELANLAGRDSCDLEISFNNYHEFIVGGKNYIFHQTFVNFKSRIKIVP